LRPRIPAKEMATQRTPGATFSTFSTRNSNAKLKMTTTMSAKTNMDVNISLLRNSRRTSFHTSAATFRTKTM
jgi:hypothetical protein